MHVHVHMRTHHFTPHSHEQSQLSSMPRDPVKQRASKQRYNQSDRLGAAASSLAVLAGCWHGQEVPACELLLAS
jgi:hypothetical protein